MTNLTTLDRFSERVAAGGRLTREELGALASGSDLLTMGMLADVARRRLHGATTTFLRVAEHPVSAVSGPEVLSSARAIRLTGSPTGLDEAIRAVRLTRAAAGDRLVEAFSWLDIEALGTDRPARADVLERLRSAGLDALAEVPLDEVRDAAAAVEELTDAGFSDLRLTMGGAPAAEAATLFATAGELQDRYGCIRVLSPLPMRRATFRPTTGYEDVKTVALARLAAPAIQTVQVDWLRYGPKLAQVALTFGADDLDSVSPSDEAPGGHRRSALEEVRRNIEAAGLEPAQRDGRFVVIG